MRLKHYWLLLTFSLCTTAMLAQSGLQTNYYDKFDWFEMKGVGKPLKKGFLHHFRKIKVISDSLGNTVEVKYLKPRRVYGGILIPRYARLWIKRIKYDNATPPMYVTNLEVNHWTSEYRQLIVPMSKDSFAYVPSYYKEDEYCIVSKNGKGSIKMSYINGLSEITSDTSYTGSIDDDTAWIAWASDYYTKDLVEKINDKLKAGPSGLAWNRLRHKIVMTFIDKRHIKVFFYGDRDKREWIRTRKELRGISLWYYSLLSTKD